MIFSQCSYLCYHVKLLLRDLDNDIEFFLTREKIHDKFSAWRTVQPILKMSEMASVSIRNTKREILPEAAVHHAYSTRQRRDNVSHGCVFL
jgi:hypothetical protein